ncbi:MAG: amidohydrolase family protein, partial [Clostridiales bacterium]
MIAEIGAVNSIPVNLSDTEIIDVSNKVMLPGLINSHVHIVADAHLDASLFVALHESETLSAFRGYRNMQELLRCGITYARDLGADNYLNIELRKARIMGLIDGAEIVTAGKCLTTTGGHIWQISRECDGVAEVRKAAREQLRAGADCIKILITGGHSTPGVHPKQLQFTADEIKAAVEITHFAHKKISAHTNGLEAIEMAVDCGIDCIEHCEFFPEDDPVKVDELVHKMAEKGVYYVPTLSAWFRDYPQKYGYLGELKKDILQQMLLRQSDNIRITTIDREYFSIQQILDNASKIYRAGVKVAMGTDSGISGLYFDKYPFEMKCMLSMG